MNLFMRRGIIIERKGWVPHTKEGGGAEPALMPKKLGERGRGLGRARRAQESGFRGAGNNSYSPLFLL